MERLLAEQLSVLEAEYPVVTTALVFTSPFELLVATVLAAQARDSVVNTVTPRLFERFPSPAAMRSASLPEIEELLGTLPLFRQKARSLLGLSERLVSVHGGSVPSGMEELTELPGVGRKTANVVRAYAFGLPALAVDTHTLRLARRLGWTGASDPVVVERDLTALLPEEVWVDVHQRLVHHGRAVCTARAPRCGACSLSGLCPSSTSP